MTNKNLGVLERWGAIFGAQICCNLWIAWFRWDCCMHVRYRFYETSLSFNSMIVGIEARRGKQETMKVFYEDDRYDSED